MKQDVSTKCMMITNELIQERMVLQRYNKKEGGASN